MPLKFNGHFYYMVQKISKERKNHSENDNKKEENELKSVSLTEYLTNIGNVISTYVSSNQWVVCEIVSFNQSKGHYYFEIIDTNEKSQRTKGNTAILFSSKVFRVFGKFQDKTGVALANGMKVMFMLNAKFDPKFGFSLHIEDINPSFTVGEMEAKANNIRAAMAKQKIENRNKNLVLPEHFFNIAVLSPSGAAGLGDFKVEADLLEKYGLCKFTYFTATFEGGEVEKSIVNAFKEIHLSGFENYDCLVFIRGGGAKSSLQYLNEELIIKCVCRTPIPIISGIGHERDKVLVDEYTSLSLDTPSKVIEYITNRNLKNIADAESLVEDIYNFSERLILESESKFEKESHQIFTLIDKIIVEFESSTNLDINRINELFTTCLNDSEFKALNLISQIDTMFEEKLTSSEHSISNVVNQILNITMEQLNDFENSSKVNIDKITDLSFKAIDDAEKHSLNLIENIKELDPKKVLDRGYSIVRTDDGVVTSIAELNQSTSFKIVMKDGEKVINN